MTPAKHAERAARAKKILAYEKKAYPVLKSELGHHTPSPCVVAVILSAQCTDKAVNNLTATLFKKYKTALDFAQAKPEVFTKEISSIPFFNNKAKAIIGAVKLIQARHGGAVPRTEAELV